MVWEIGYGGAVKNLRVKNRLRILETSRGDILEIEVVVPGSGRIAMPPSWLPGSIVRVRITDQPRRKREIYEEEETPPPTPPGAPTVF